jgi:hypothetical protein
MKWQRKKLMLMFVIMNEPQLLRNKTGQFRQQQQKKKKKKIGSSICRAIQPMLTSTGSVNIKVR